MSVFEGKTLLKKRVLPFKLPFPKNFSIASAVQQFYGNNCISVALPLWKDSPFLYYNSPKCPALPVIQYLFVLNRFAGTLI